MFTSICSLASAVATWSVTLTAGQNARVDFNADATKTAAAGEPLTTVLKVNVPENVAGHRYFAPTNRGFEAKLRERLERIREIYAREGATGGTIEAREDG